MVVHNFKSRTCRAEAGWSLEFKAIVVYRVSTREAKDTQRNLFSKKYKTTITTKKNRKNEWILDTWSEAPTTGRLPFSVREIRKSLKNFTLKLLRLFHVAKNKSLLYNKIKTFFL